MILDSSQLLQDSSTHLSTSIRRCLQSFLTQEEVRPSTLPSCAAQLPSLH